MTFFSLWQSVDNSTYRSNAHLVQNDIMYDSNGEIVKDFMWNFDIESVLAEKPFEETLEQKNIDYANQLSKTDQVFQEIDKGIITKEENEFILYLRQNPPLFSYDLNKYPKKMNGEKFTYFTQGRCCYLITTLALQTIFGKKIKKCIQFDFLAYHQYNFFVYHSFPQNTKVLNKEMLFYQTLKADCFLPIFVSYSLKNCNYIQEKGIFLTEVIDQLNFSQKYVIFKQILQLVKSLHEKNIFCQGINLSHFLAKKQGNDWIVKIGNVSINYDIRYHAPEVFLDNKKSEEALDVWGLGIIFYYLFTDKQNHLFQNALDIIEDYEKKGVLLKNLNSQEKRTFSNNFMLDNFTLVSSKSRKIPRQEKAYIENVNALLKELLECKPEKRITMTQAINRL
ncbi:Protein kinase domain protein [Candidatus Rubidus massiliensis]|nr:Protein kinase domain protein [Candidatus Rubidus massiliensis]